jgi:nitrile hydratase accessory protein
MDRPDPEPVFREPWEASAFALAVALHARGVFTWPEWAAALAQQIARAQAQAQAGSKPDTGEHYYHYWLATLEQLLAERGVAPAEEVHLAEHAWARAAARTPHGQPITLEPGDYAGQSA